MTDACCFKRRPTSKVYRQQQSQVTHSCARPRWRCCRLASLLLGASIGNPFIQPKPATVALSVFTSSTSLTLGNFLLAQTLTFRSYFFHFTFTSLLVRFWKFPSQKYLMAMPFLCLLMYVCPSITPAVSSWRLLKESCEIWYAGYTSLVVPESTLIHQLRQSSLALKVNKKLHKFYACWITTAFYTVLLHSLFAKQMRGVPKNVAR